MELFQSGAFQLAMYLICAGALAICGFLGGKVVSFRNEHKQAMSATEDFRKHEEGFDELLQMQINQNAALREIVGFLMDMEHARLVEQGYASSPEKLRFERLYKPYHAIGGNGTRTSHYNDVMEMNTYPSKS